MMNGDEQDGTFHPDRTKPKIRNEQLSVYGEERKERERLRERNRERERGKCGAILVWTLSWKLQPHYKWRHPEHMYRQTNGVRRARRGATPWRCNTVPPQSNAPTPPTPTPRGTHPSSEVTVACSSQSLNISSFWGVGVEDRGQTLGVRG